MSAKPPAELWEIVNSHGMPIATYTDEGTARGRMKGATEQNRYHDPMLPYTVHRYVLSDTGRQESKK